MVDIDFPASTTRSAATTSSLPAAKRSRRTSSSTRSRARRSASTEGAAQLPRTHGSESLMSSLKSVSGYQVPPGEISTRLTQTEGVCGDIYSLMALITQLSNDQKKQMQDVKGKGFDFADQVDGELGQGGENRRPGEKWQGIITGAITIAASVGGGIGSGQGRPGGFRNRRARASRVPARSPPPRSSNPASATTRTRRSPRISTPKKFEEMRSKTQDALDGRPPRSRRR